MIYGNSSINTCNNFLRHLCPSCPTCVESCLCNWNFFICNYRGTVLASCLVIFTISMFESIINHFVLGLYASYKSQVSLNVAASVRMYLNYFRTRNVAETFGCCISCACNVEDSICFVCLGRLHNTDTERMLYDVECEVPFSH